MLISSGSDGLEASAKSYLGLVLLAIAILVVTVSVYLAPIQEVVRPNARAYWTSEVYDDPSGDGRSIMRMMEAAPTFAQSLSFWTTADYNGYRFWRPLAKTAYWIEWKTFGHDFEYWGAVSVCLYYICAATFGWMVFALTRRIPVMLLAVFLFAGVRPFMSLLYPVFDTPNHTPALCAMAWKDQPDLWLDTCIFAALALFANGSYGASLAMTVVAIGFKEPGWLTFPLALGMYLLRRPHLSKKTVYPWIATIVILIAIRIAITHGTYLEAHCMSAGPHRPFHNIGWPNRYLAAAGGIFIINSITHPGTAFLAMAIGILAGITKARHHALPILLVAATGSVIAQGMAFHLPGDAALAGMLDWSDFGAYAMGSTLFAIAFAAAMSSKQLRLTALFCAFSALLSATMFIPVDTMHVLHLAHGWQAAFVALLTICAWEQFAAGAQARWQSRTVAA